MRALTTLVLTIALLSLLTGCVSVPGTGRSQLILTSVGTENSMGLQAYQEVLKTEKRCTDPQINAVVQRVGARLAAAAPQKGFEYEFVVLESPTANAFCLPGGKVAVYTGILPYCQNEAGLAVVMGHEIAHAIARHGGERMSQQLLVQGAAMGLGVFLQTRGVEPTKANLALAAFGAGAQIGILLPYSRTHEYEADYLGMMYMAQAGYDPNEAPAFWQRFGSEPSAPAWLSTHPHSPDRAERMNKRLGRALKQYESSPRCGRGEAFPQRYLQAPKK